jgi:hypothetical protein
LPEQLLRAIRKYDPGYSEKVKLIVEVIDEKLGDRKQFCVADLGRHLEFNATSHLRMLVRRGHLAGAGQKGEPGFQRADWPPPASLFDNGPIGLTYCVQMWFRYYLQQWIENSMSEVESKEDILQLEHRGRAGDESAQSSPGSSDLAISSESTPAHRGPNGKLLNRSC